MEDKDKGATCFQQPDASGDPRPESNYVSIRVYVPELNIEKALHFMREELVWNVKQQCLATLPKELRESFNYGLFYPPSNGRAGKFLDEERPLSDYPFNGPVGYLELKYKRRVYKMLHLDEKQLRSLHTRVNLRRFLDYVIAGQAEKISKMCAKGLDPNFHCQETGETPLTLAAVSSRPGPLLLALVGGGALLDYRTRCGSTALHRAAEKNNIEAVRTLLDLGASPNVRDGKGLTPLYNAILAKAAPMLCQALLHDYSILGVQDAQGWHEIHQACRNGLVQHLENLLFYGADMNARNASGNTPLHVCAVDNQEVCARLLLFRGGDREALNYANQTPYQVAVIAGNLDLASLIHRFKDEDVVPFKETPSYNPRRRKSAIPMRHSASSSRLDLSYGLHTSTSNGASTNGSTFTANTPSGSGGIQVFPPHPPPSPSPSERWLELAPLCTSSASVRSSSSSCTAESEDNASANGSSLTDKISVDQCDVVSDSSGVGTSNSGSGGSYDATPTEHSLILPGMTVVCLEPYSSKEPNHLTLQPGDIVEVTGSTDCGLLEGWLRGDSGYFSPNCVQEVRLRHPAAIAAAKQHHSPAGVNVGSSTIPRVNMEQSSCSRQTGKLANSRIPGRREMSEQHYHTTPRFKSIYGEPRTVILHKGQRGFGFVIRGAKATNTILDLKQHRVPALQYLDSVETGSVADRAGLRPGDFIIAINGEDLAQASHETVVDAIRRSGNLVTMTVCSAVQMPNEFSSLSKNRQCSTLPRKLPGLPPQPPKRDPRTTLSVGRARARSMVAGLTEMETAQNLNSTQEIYSTATLRTASIRSRSGSGRVSTSDLEKSSAPTAVAPPAPPLSSIPPRTPRIYASVAEMKRMKKQRAHALELLKLHKDFHSTPDLNWEQEINGELMTTSWTEGESAVENQPSSEDWRKSQSQDDVYNLRMKLLNKRNSRHSWAFQSQQGYSNNTRYHGSWQSIEEVYRSGEHPDGEDDEETEEEQDDQDEEDATTPIVDQITLLGNGDYRTVKPCRPVYSGGNNIHSKGSTSPHAPPPSHPPPPPPPPSQMIRVDVTKSHSEYAVVSSTGAERPSTPVMSSFRPSDSAKLYALPDDVTSVGYMTTKPQSKSSSAASRSQSLPPRSARPNISVKANGMLRNEAISEKPSVTLVVNSSPVIPEPDYDEDDDDEDDDVPTMQSSPNGIPKSSFGDQQPEAFEIHPGHRKSSTEERQKVRIEIKHTTSTVPKSQSFSMDILKAKSRLKTSQSYPEDFSEEKLVSSNSEDVYVTFVPVNLECNGASEQNTKDRNNRRTATLTRHAVSLIQLPPPAESGEIDDAELIDERLIKMREMVEQDSVSTISTLSSLSTSSNSTDRDNTVLENKPLFPSKETKSNAKYMKNSEEKNDTVRTIEESIQLIRMNVHSLSDMSGLAKTAPVVPPPPEFGGSSGSSRESTVAPDTEDATSAFIPPPPPEFSDSSVYFSLVSNSRTLPKSLSSGHLRNNIDDDFARTLSQNHYQSLKHRGIERRLSDDTIALNKNPTVRIVGAVPKKVSFSPDVIDSETRNQTRSFRNKMLEEWTIQDTADWLDSLLLQEYKAAFIKKNMDGQKLMRLNNDTLLSLGVKRVKHRLDIEKSLRRFIHTRTSLE